MGFAETRYYESLVGEHNRDWSYDKCYEDRLKWNGWYDRDWIRMPDVDCDESNPLKPTLYGMPDFKDERWT
ncbi:MAG: hypothetical protein K2M87_04100 [Muribaculaceae bacterium]|nr:hypothetical protein [Muribaculaceae bacterium]